jgi:hypothetical protein
MNRPAKFEIAETDEFLTSHSGLALVGALLEKCGIREGLHRLLPVKKRADALSSYDALASMAGLLSLAKPDYAAIEQFRDDDFFKSALGLQLVASEPTLRQRLDEIASVKNAASIIDELLKGSARMLHDHAPALAPCFKDFIAIDADVSPFDNSDTKKEGVSCTYKMHDGYAPMFAYIGNEGYLLNTELREGKQHCQKGTPEFLEKSFVLARTITDKRLLLRLDSGNDAFENVKVCRKAKVDFIIKRNIRHESVDEWLLTAKAYGEWRIPRDGKTVFVGDTIGVKDGKRMRIVFEVIERTSNHDGQIFLVPEIQINTWWTSLGVRTASADEVIGLYHDHGTSEQYHSELKTDMDIERLPSGKMATNSLILTLAVPVFNILRLAGQVAMQTGYQPKKKVTRRRIRTVIQDLVYMAARIVKHARRLVIALSKRNPFRKIWAVTYETFSAV